ncbi:MAG: hypothetical protein P1U54_09025 [Immundisolibacteraceae bacterium]|nr:hypothetical protein [Immundisolibacteraceae bacterium]
MGCDYNPLVIGQFSEIKEDHATINLTVVEVIGPTMAVSNKYNTKPFPGFNFVNP